MRRAWLLAGACVIYVIAAWSVRPGFYDGFAAPKYAYVSPPALLASDNVQPKAGSGTLKLAADGHVSGGFIATPDQPVAQASIDMPDGALSPPSTANRVTIEIRPYAPPRDVAGITLEGNVYCITANTDFKPGTRADVTLLVPASEPFPSAIYSAPDRGAPWTSLGGQVDQLTYLMTTKTPAFGCFGVGYPKPKAGAGPTLGGPLLPWIVAVLIALVVLAGLPLAVRRRLTGRRD